MAKPDPTHSTPPAILASTLWLALFDAQRALQACASVGIEGAEIGLSEFSLLEQLKQRGPLAVNELGRCIHLTSGSITTAVDRMQKRGLVTRSSDAADRRARIVNLTRKGSALIGRASTSHAAAIGRALGGLSKGERATLISLLKKVSNSAETC